MDSDAEKKHEPSDRQWREAAESGQLPRSTEAMTAATLLAGAFALTQHSELLVAGVVAAWVRCWTAPDVWTIESSASLLASLGLDLMRSVAAPFALATAAAVGVGLAMTRGQLASEALAFKPERLDPIAHAKRTFLSSEPWIELLRNGLRIGVVAMAVWNAVGSAVSSWPKLAASPPEAMADALVQVGWDVVVAAIPWMVALAVADYAWSWWQLRQRLMRTDEQLREDHKALEGDPKVRAMRKQRARELLRKAGGGLRQVRTADVVVTNPTHFAVALRYKRGTDRAPVVVAKGVDHAALRIREEAVRHGVPRVEDRPLARALHARAQLGRPIPDGLFGPVARVLAVVFARRRAAASR
jgi:flagellar biosynthetic protein FlhB